MSDDEKRIQADVLLSGYKEAKAEISRRSTLSWTAVAGYLLFLFRCGTAVVDGNKNPVALSGVGSVLRGLRLCVHPVFRHPRAQLLH